MATEESGSGLPEKRTGAAYWASIAGVTAFTIAAVWGVGYAAGVRAIYVAIFSAAFLLIFLLPAFLRPSEVTAAAKARSPKRPFLERVRRPDPDFATFLLMLELVIPLSIAFFVLALTVFVEIAEALVHLPGSATSWLSSVAAFISWLLIPVMIAAYLSLWSLRAYVAVKLRRKSGRESSDRLDPPDRGGDPTLPPSR